LPIFWGREEKSTPHSGNSRLLSPVIAEWRRMAFEKTLQNDSGNADIFLEARVWVVN
jgi:hypothetical protein